MKSLHITMARPPPAPAPCCLVGPLAPCAPTSSLPTRVSLCSGASLLPPLPSPLLGYQHSPPPSWGCTGPTPPRGAGGCAGMTSPTNGGQGVSQGLSPSVPPDWPDGPSRNRLSRPAPAPRGEAEGPSPCPQGGCGTCSAPRPTLGSPQGRPPGSRPSPASFRSGGYRGTVRPAGTHSGR